MVYAHTDHLSNDCVQLIHGSKAVQLIWVRAVQDQNFGLCQLDQFCYLVCTHIVSWFWAVYYRETITIAKVGQLLHVEVVYPAWVFQNTDKKSFEVD